MDTERLVDRYRQRRAARAARAARMTAFFARKQGFLVVQNPGGAFYTRCNTVADLTRANLESFAAAVALEWTDDLPYLEPIAERNYRLATTALAEVYA